MENNNFIQLKNISKSFTGVLALNDATIDIKKATVHALVGENGAGKSTLAKIICGAYQRDSGEYILDGKPVDFRNEMDAIRGGVAMVYQELNYVPEMSIGENLFLGREPKTKLGTIDTKKRNEDAKKILGDIGLSYDVSMPIGKLSVADIQMIEIAKAVSRNASVIIFDEPTSSISDKEIKTLFGMIESLKSKGITIIYITHKFDELDAMADYITIMRDGNVIETRAKKNLTHDEMINMMVGRPMSLYYPKTEHKKGDVVLSVKNLTKNDVFKNINFEVRAGEILGFSGLIGAGRSEVMSAIFGMLSYDKGEIYLNSEKLNIKTPWEAKDAGIAYVPEDRKRTGLVLCRSIKENTSLPHLNSYRSWFLKTGDESRDVNQQMKRFNVKATGQNVAVNNLSGGNQQKVVLSKWLLKTPKVLILDEPTRGIDVGAKQEIYKHIDELAEEGLAIILVSSELPEVMGMSDRIAVMCEGNMTATLDRSEISAETIMKYAVLGMK